MSTTTATRERPILFSAPMIRAILDGHKTQTRRVVKGVQLNNCLPLRKATKRFVGTETHVLDAPARGLCPYGYVGDRLWVREAWTADMQRSVSEAWGLDGCAWWHHVPAMARGERNTAMLYYRADDAIVHASGIGEAPWEQRRSTWTPSEEDLEDRRWYPSIHMPRWASRITLEITGVRVELLRDISAADAWAEGVRPEGVPACAGDGEQDHADPEGATVDAYRALWDGINGKTHPWERNPWVWVVEFKRCEATNA